MNTKSIEMTLLYENGYGKIYINKDYHLVDVETENPKDFFESLRDVSDLLGDELSEGNMEVKKDFMYTQTAVTAIQTCTLTHKHQLQWDPLMASIEVMAKDQNVNLNNPMEVMNFMVKTIGNL
jgi:hypothetical protein